MNHCMRHYEEPTVALCRTCQRPFCSRCLVFSFGPSKPPFCVGCALAASGVRNGVKVTPPAPVEVPAVDRRAEKAQRKADKAAAKAVAKATKAARGAEAPLAPLLPDPLAPRSTQVPRDVVVISAR